MIHPSREPDGHTENPPPCRKRTRRKKKKNENSRERKRPAFPLQPSRAIGNCKSDPPKRLTSFKKRGRKKLISFKITNKTKNGTNKKKQTIAERMMAACFSSPKRIRRGKRDYQSKIKQKKGKGTSDEDKVCDLLRRVFCRPKRAKCFNSCFTATLISVLTSTSSRRSCEILLLDGDAVNSWWMAKSSTSDAWFRLHLPRDREAPFSLFWTISFAFYSSLFFVFYSFLSFFFRHSIVPNRSVGR
eukprot:TRINITY_DN2494_c0_g1_i3.p1 TRINITY_DN2494_c0_g1~~TRINITY_DN2494_c0_g1_i3.p1  ORF type:complete len:244 (-),score=17.42 TRINITY_DN2494_c0_g1_i3:260-991(-)